MKYTNQRNVDYLREDVGRIVSTGDKILTVEYNYVYALALCGRTWNRFIYRHFVDNFARPRLYRQTLEGMEAV